MALIPVKSFLKQIDLHGYPIALRYHNQITYKTSVGGMITLLSRLGIFAYFLALVFNIVNHEKTVTFKSINKSANSGNQSNLITLDNFDIGFGLSFYDGKPHLLEKANIKKYFSIDFTVILFDFVDSNGTQVIKRYLDPISYSQCQLGRFANSTNDMIQMGMDQAGWYCIDRLNFTLIAQLYSNRKSSLRFTIQPCTNTTLNNNSCATQEEIDLIMKMSVIQLVMLKSYFDQDEFDKNPAKSEIMLLPLNYRTDQAYSMAVYLQKHIVTTKDYWMSSFIMNKVYDYYKVILGPTNVGLLRPGINAMSTIQVFNMDEEIQVERQVTTLVDILAVAGGFTNFIMLVTRIISRIYSRPSLDQQLISSLYSQVSNKNPHNRSSRFSDIEADREMDNSQKLEMVQRALLERKPLMINTLKHAVLQFLKRCRCKSRYTQEQQFMHYAYTQMNKKFDIIYIVKSIRKMKAALKLILKDHQYALIPYMKKNYLHLNNTKTTIKSKNPKKLITLSKVVENKDEDLKSLDKRLMKLAKCKQKISTSIIEDLMEVAGCSNKNLLEDFQDETMKSSSRKKSQRSSRALADQSSSFRKLKKSSKRESEKDKVKKLKLENGAFVTVGK